MNKIGFTSTTFRQIKNLGKIVEIAVKIGVNVIEWGGDIHVKNIEEAKRAKQLCDIANIEISSYGSYYIVGSNDAKYWESVCKIASTMGAKFVRVWLGKKSTSKTSKTELDNLVADLKNMCDVAKNYHLFVTPECHNNTHNDSVEGFLSIANLVQKENFATYFQSYYKNIEKDFFRLEKTYKNTSIFHVSYSELTRNQIFSKKDKLYIDKLVNKLNNLHYDGIILIEYTYFASPKFLAKDITKLKILLSD